MSPAATADDGPRLRRVLVANRGEIAVRVIRAAHETGVEAVAVYSDADAESEWVRLADASVHLGPSQATKSYLDVDKVVAAALDSDCDAVHPGYGFLSERASFARAVEDAGLVFVGPRPETIEQMGDKAMARAAAERSGVPVVPGSGVLAGPEEGEATAEDIGYPVLVKASAGGGGRGIRLVERPEDLAAAISTASREAQAAFGDGAVYLEKALTHARHVEVQVLADEHGGVWHTFERDCSVQRRRQKLLEEAPAPGLSESLRAGLAEAAVRLAREVGYRGAGTVEFLVADEEFFFIEMNTRIQVEHPISEEVTGVDLVAAQLEVAAGRALPLEQDRISIDGVALEFRINAEDPDQDFFPSPGTLERFDLPSGPGVRIETGFAAGDTVSPFYDSLLAKVVVHGATRDEALARGRQALGDLHVEGVKTTTPVQLRILDELAAGPVHTQWLEGWLTEG